MFDYLEKKYLYSVCLFHNITLTDTNVCDSLSVCKDVTKDKKTKKKVKN